MPQDYKVLNESVRNRSNPEHVALQKTFSLELSDISYSDVLIYVRLAMRGVEPEYTQKSKLAGERVKEHLSRELSNVRFEYQGSVMTNTHIKAYSDIDLLTISNKFYSRDIVAASEVVNSASLSSKYYNDELNRIKQEISYSVYSGNSNDDLRSLRLSSERILENVYSVCDTSHAKAIKITNTSLHRDVDVVIANYYDDVKSIINGKGVYRGIQVYNKELNAAGLPDYPFFSIERINTRSAETSGRLKKMIRFLKNMKAKSGHDIKLSSFDFNAICYDIRVDKYLNLNFYTLVAVLYKQIKSICDSKSHSDSLTSVDGREYIFRERPDKLVHLKNILSEIENVYNDLIKENILM